MALSPCFNCNQRFEGQAQNLYLSFFVGDESVKFRHIVCPPCVGDLVDGWITKALHRDADGRWRDPDPAETLEGLLAAPQGPTAIAWRR